jgi:hypothetical protein
MSEPRLLVVKYGDGRVSGPPPWLVWLVGDTVHLKSPEGKEFTVPDSERVVAENEELRLGSNESAANQQAAATVALCETEWRCPVWGCGYIVRLLRQSCNSFGPSMTACPNCGGEDTRWDQVAHRNLVRPSEEKLAAAERLNQERFRKIEELATSRDRLAAQFLDEKARANRAEEQLVRVNEAIRTLGLPVFIGEREEEPPGP